MIQLKDQVRGEVEPRRPSVDGPGSGHRDANRFRDGRSVVLGGFGLLLIAGLVVGLIVVLRPAKQPLMSGSQGQIVFSRAGLNGGLYLMDADGTGLRQVSSVAGDDHAAWSPDGTQIAFNRYRNGNQDVYVVRADGKGLMRLTSDGASSSPAWSADGAKIVFARETAGSADLFVMNADGSDTMRLTNDALLEYTPVWSPDGMRIAFVAYSKGPPSSPTHLYVINADGSGRSEIGPDNAALPSWAPDASKLAFVDEDDGSIYLSNPDGSGLRRVIELAGLPGAADFPPNFTSRPAWSPNGTKLLFAAGNATTSHLYTVRLDGSDLVQLTHGSVSDTSPAWSEAGG
jgi:Tol biopolymer transport system component